MSSDPITSYTSRARVVLVLLGIRFGWTAYDGYQHLKPWMDGTMFESQPTGDIGQMIDLAFYIIVFTGIAGVANVVLAAIAGKKPTLAIYTAIGIFAVYTALRIYQTDGHYLSYWLWWVTAVVLGIGCHAVFKANQLRKLQLATARVFA